ncbi:TraE/TraK family type IV conjugative transfer system protein, partial [Enterobacter hormaechei]|uniref:TraE/TraK family type IV conjugative transfer system protein n=1 Tax=Enterobacter hormaechei TaxID=158836 RepID=UPI000B28B8E2
TEINVYPVDGRIDVRGVLKMWIGNSKRSTEIKTYRLRLKYTGGFILLRSWVSSHTRQSLIRN